MYTGAEVAESTISIEATNHVLNKQEVLLCPHWRDKSSPNTQNQTNHGTMNTTGYLHNEMDEQQQKNQMFGLPQLTPFDADDRISQRLRLVTSRRKS